MSQMSNWCRRMKYSSTQIIPFNFLIILSSLSHQTKRARFVYCYKRADFDGLRKSLRDTPFDSCFQNDDINDNWQCWYNFFITAVEQHVPTLKIRNVNNPPWIDGEILHLLHLKNSIHPIWEKYRALRRQIKSAITRKHKEYVDSLSGSLKDNRKRFWSYLKARTKSGSIPNIVESNNLRYQDPKDKAEAFNNYIFPSFTSSADDLPIPDFRVDSDSGV